MKGLTCGHRATLVVIARVAVLLIWSTGTISAAAADLYRTKTVVTGQDEANRLIGFGRCLEDILIKLSGAQKLAGDRLAGSSQVEREKLRQGVQLSRPVRRQAQA